MSLFWFTSEIKKKKVILRESCRDRVDLSEPPYFLQLAQLGQWAWQHTGSGRKHLPDQRSQKSKSTAIRCPALLVRRQLMPSYKADIGSLQATSQCPESMILYLESLAVSVQGASPLICFLKVGLVVFHLYSLRTFYYTLPAKALTSSNLFNSV